MAGLFQSVFSTFVRKAAHEKTTGRGLVALGVGFVATRIATRSIPGALSVGAVLVAKHFIDKHREEDAAVNTAKEAVEAHPDVASELLREKPEIVTDEYDDKELIREIDERAGARSKVER